MRRYIIAICRREFLVVISLNCSKCGKFSERSYSGMCQGCYIYFKNGGKVFDLPSPGIIKRDKSGKVICHICGRSYNRLGSHVNESHGLTIAEYKEKFGLCARAKTTEESYSRKMHNYAIKNGIDKIISIMGLETRIKPGERHLRAGKKIRLQEKIEKERRRYLHEKETSPQTTSDELCRHSED